MKLPLIVLEPSRDPLFRVVYQDGAIGDAWAMLAFAEAEADQNSDQTPVGMIQVRDSSHGQAAMTKLLAQFKTAA